jgi:hypothetical protein
MKKVFITIAVLLLLPFSVYVHAVGPGGFASTGATADDTAYDASTWDSNTDAATKNALRDKFESLATGAPVGAKYIVQQADATLSAEQALGDLATGIVKNTTTTGELSIATEGTDYYKPGGTNVSVADGGTGVSSLAAHQVLLGNGTNGVNVAAAGSNGQVLVGSTGADTADHDYVISHDTVAASADYTGTVTNAVNLSYDADGNGADGDHEQTTETTLTNWKSNLTAGNLWVIRVARDGDDGTNDASEVDSYSGPLIIKYGVSQ